MPEMRAAVVGAGRLGALHATKYARAPGVSLEFVVDIDRARAERVAVENGARALNDFRDLSGRVDLASIAAPGAAHFEIAAFLLASGIDLLVEKPMAATVTEARKLARLAEEHGRILQIGHLERFNPAVQRLRPLVNDPRFVESHRLAPFTERGTDVDVILDLMVHDLDVILTVAPSEVVSIESLGVSILTDRIDLANARIRFQSGLIANLNASRVAPRRERKIRFFQPDAYISLDYEARRIQLYRKEPPAPGSAYPTISARRIDLPVGDPLGEEVASFIACVRDRGTPAVTARDGLRVVELSERIVAAMETGPAKITD